MRKLVWMLPLALGMLACSAVKDVVVKDIPLEEQKAILKEYKNRHVWTREVLQDLGEGGSIPRDEKVTIIDVSMVYQGSVTVQTLKKKNKVRQGLNIDPPLSREKIDAALGELFFFEDPTLRHVSYIRKYGKKTARAIMDHDLFANMPAEAVRESWGTPTKVNSNDVGGVITEQWIYPTAQAGKSKYVYLRDGKVFRWEE